MQVLACIGEQFTEGDEICGVAVNIRGKGDRIELWTKTASNEAVQVCCKSNPPAPAMPGAVHMHELLPACALYLTAFTAALLRCCATLWAIAVPGTVAAHSRCCAACKRLTGCCLASCAQTIIGRQLKQFLDMPDSLKIGYSVFSEKLSAGSKAKDRYSV